MRMVHFNRFRGLFANTRRIRGPIWARPGWRGAGEFVEDSDCNQTIPNAEETSGGGGGRIGMGIG